MPLWHTDCLKIIWSGCSRTSEFLVDEIDTCWRWPDIQSLTFPQLTCFPLKREHFKRKPDPLNQPTLLRGYVNCLLFREYFSKNQDSTWFETQQTASNKPAPYVFSSHPTNLTHSNPKWPSSEQSKFLRWSNHHISSLEPFVPGTNLETKRFFPPKLKKFSLEKKQISGLPILGITGFHEGFAA